MGDRCPGARGVNEQLSLWDDQDAMQLTPPSLRPWVEVPVLDREQLKSLLAELVPAVGVVAGPAFSGANH